MNEMRVVFTFASVIYFSFIFPSSFKLNAIEYLFFFFVFFFFYCIVVSNSLVDANWKSWMKFAPSRFIVFCLLKLINAKKYKLRWDQEIAYFSSWMKQTFLFFFFLVLDKNEHPNEMRCASRDKVNIPAFSIHFYFWLFILFFFFGIKNEYFVLKKTKWING